MVERAVAFNPDYPCSSLFQAWISALSGLSGAPPRRRGGEAGQVDLELVENENQLIKLKVQYFGARLIFLDLDVYADAIQNHSRNLVQFHFFYPYKQRIIDKNPEFPLVPCLC